jgi:hypothetical protein
MKAGSPKVRSKMRPVDRELSSIQQLTLLGPQKEGNNSKKKKI